MVEEGFWDVNVTERATRTAVQNATVVKKPKAFCNRTNDECIVVDVEKKDKSTLRMDR